MRNRNVQDDVYVRINTCTCICYYIIFDSSNDTLSKIIQILYIFTYTASEQLNARTNQEAKFALIWYLQCKIWSISLWQICRNICVSSVTVGASAVHVALGWASVRDVARQKHPQACCVVPPRLLGPEDTPKCRWNDAIIIWRRPRHSQKRCRPWIVNDVAWRGYSTPVLRSV